MIGLALNLLFSLVLESYGLFILFIHFTNKMIYHESHG